MSNNHASGDGKWREAYEKAVSDLMDLLAARADLNLQIESQNALVKLLWELLKPP